MSQCTFQNLSRIITEITSMEYLPHDINLVSALRGASILPLSSLINHSKFIRLYPTLAEIVSACEKSEFLCNRIIYYPDPCLVLPFFVDPTVLIIENVKDTNMNDFRLYIKTVLGHGYFEVHPYSPHGSYKTRFADIPTAISFWRALNYFPINGGFVKCFPISSTSPFPEKEKLVPIPQRKKKINRTERKRRNKMKNKKIAEEANSASSSVNQSSEEMNQKPQAALMKPTIHNPVP